LAICAFGLDSALAGPPRRTGLVQSNSVDRL